MNRKFLKSTKHAISTNLGLSNLYARNSYSQEGEDMVLIKMFDGKKDGFFVDVGAHHPYRYSNTYVLYEQGWRGINIDATPDSMKAFSKTREKDINLEMAVSDTTGDSTMYIFEDSALNTLSETKAGEVESSEQSKLIEKVEVETRKLKDVLDEYLPEDISIDLLNVDVEGADMEVLKSNDWKKYQPKIVVVEDMENMPIEKVSKREVVIFLNKKGYQLQNKTGNSLIFKKVRD